MLRVVQKHKAFLLFLFIAPFFVTAPTYAEDVDYNINVVPSIKITVPTDDIVLNVNPSSQPFDSGGTRILVSTNSLDGYKLVMTADGSDLVKTDNEHIVIPTLPAHEGGYTESSFEANKWGYGIDGGNYLPFAPDTLIKETDTMADEDPTDFSVAAKVDFTQTDGTYRTTITFTAVANIVFDYIQDITPALCSTIPTTVIDSRDGEEYIIQKLADGNCWMMSNLNLGATALTGDLTSSNTNITDTVSASDFNSWRKETGSGSSTSGEYVPLSGTDSTSGTKYGTLYNFCAASAGTVCRHQDEYEAYDDLEDTAYDICPAGWRLPNTELGGLFSRAEYDTIEEVHASSSDGGFALPFAGYFKDTRLLQMGKTGALWTSKFDYKYESMGIVSAYDDEEGVQINLGSAYHYRNEGISVRCILKKDKRTLSDITYMQEINPEIVINTQAPASKILLDSRDDKSYRVVKYRSGMFMGENLRFTGTYITPEDTNINVAKTLTYFQTDSDNECEPIANGGNGENTLCIKELIDTEGNPTVWYNFPAATAGTVTAEADEQLGLHYIAETGQVTGSYGSAEYDICPKGWTILDGTGLDKFYELFNPVLDNLENITPGGWDHYYRTAWWRNTKAFNWAVMLLDVYSHNEYHPGDKGRLYSDMDCQVPMYYGRANLRCAVKMDK